MEHSLQVDIKAEVLPGPIRVTAEGCLTESNVESLLDVLDQAIALEGCPSINIDLLGLGHVGHAEVRLLQSAISVKRTIPGAPMISIVTPSLPRHCAVIEPAQELSPKKPTGAADR